MQRKLVSALVAAGAALAIAAPVPGSAAKTYRISAILLPRNEVPTPKAPVRAQGRFVGILTPKANGGGTLVWALSSSGLSGHATAAHIHRGAPGAAGPIVVNLCRKCTGNRSGKLTLGAAIVRTIQSGGAYVNVHTAKNPGGEIRGQLLAK